jgi:predicted glycosyltransferase
MATVDDSRLIWIDFSTAPDPLFFRPIISRLTALGHRLWITAREYGETIEIATSCGFDIEVVGRHGGRSTAAKAAAIAQRAVVLAARARLRHPDLAVSFNSYAQAVACRLSGVPFVTLTDYEYQPANHLAFRLARTVIVPDGFDRGSLRRQGAPMSAVVAYPGLKEHVTLADFKPDPAFPAALRVLGITEGQILVTMRPPATSSLYHRFANDFFYTVVAHVASRRDVVVLVLPRYSAQAERIRQLGLANVIIPGRVLDGLNLVRSSDLVISAGGSMNREAVALGTPAATVFAGKMAGVDRKLIRDGTLAHLRSREDLDGLVVEKKGVEEAMATFDPSPVDTIVDAILVSGSRGDP